MRSPSLKEVDIVELVKFHGELEGGLQVAHGSCEELARARAARRAMPRPLPARKAHAGTGLTAWARTHARTALTTPALRTPHSTRPALRDAGSPTVGRVRGSTDARRPNAPADADVRLTVREPGIHFLIAASAHAPRPSRT